MRRLDPTFKLVMTLFGIIMAFGLFLACVDPLVRWLLAEPK